DEKILFYAQVAMFLHVQILQGSIIATDGTPISSGHYVLQGARPALCSVVKNGGLGGALWDEDTFVISLEEGHYVAYIKMMALKYMTDEDVVVEALILSDVTDLYSTKLFLLSMNVSMHSTSLHNSSQFTEAYWCNFRLVFTYAILSCQSCFYVCSKFISIL
ncbi:hypothetical protein ACJX0J_024629, partial [Zea mays]